MFKPSLTVIFSGIFLAYMANSLWTIGSLYLPPSCDKNCLRNGALHSPEFSAGLRLVLLSTESRRPQSNKDLKYITSLDILDLNSDYSQEIRMKLSPKVTKKNATQYLAMFSLPVQDKLDNAEKKWPTWIRSEKAVYTLMTLTRMHVPEAETFQLIGGKDDKDDDPSGSSSSLSSTDKVVRHPVAHMRSVIKINVMTDNVDIPTGKAVPAEIFHLLRFNPDGKNYLPIIFYNELSMRTRELVRINQTDKADMEVTFALNYSPISFGKLRLFSQFQSSLSSLHSLGFTEKDTDEVKGIFADTNLALLLVTFGVSAVHLLFDFLAFKNDISFWRNRQSMEGLSTTTVLWRAFSQSIIFLYLMDEETSLLVLIPSGIAALIEGWKVTKAFKVQLVKTGSVTFKLDFGSKQTQSQAEQDTNAYDSESLKYLSYVLYPLCLGGAVYSLLYMPHKSWYSWTISSLVNGVYAFGFLFMLPQLFINYRLKSVAHLPWRAFMYKAFNTFIDDLFAFIITMPTAHRVACFRDDIVFLVYLYQRYLYPVDKTRIDMSGGMIEEETSDQHQSQPVVNDRSDGVTTRSSRKAKKE